MQLAITNTATVTYSLNVETVRAAIVRADVAKKIVTFGAILACVVVAVFM